MIMKKMYTHLLDEEEDVVEVVEGEWEGEGVEVHVETDMWSMVTVAGRVSMLLLMQATGMLIMLRLMEAMVMHVVEAVVSEAVAGEVAMVASLIISKREGEVAMVATGIISKMEGIMTMHQHHPEVVAVVSGAMAGEVATVASLIISTTEGFTMRHLLHLLEAAAVVVGEAQPGAEGVVAIPMVWCTPLLPLRKLVAAPLKLLPLVGCLLQV
ncbi:hypothetical protein ACQ4PT_031040 [Festuca glaucescens]